MTVAINQKQELEKQNPMNEISQFMELSGVLATCPYYQKLGKGGILAIILTAKEMGLPPMACLNGGMYTFSGAVSLSAQLMNMMIVNAGHMVEIVVLDAKICTLRFTRKDRPRDKNSFVYSFTMEMAQSAGLTSKTNWKTNPRDMLFNRCLSGGARKFLPDAIMNAYAIGELPGDDNIIDTVPVSSTVYEDETPKETETPIEKPIITEEQYDELNGMFCKCSSDFQVKINEYLKENKINSLSLLPQECYEKIKKRLTLKSEEYQATLKGTGE